NSPNPSWPRRSSSGWPPTPCCGNCARSSRWSAWCPERRPDRQPDMGQQSHRRYVTADPETVDDSRCTVMHLDMDAFFAAVELQRRPELVGTEMMVAGTGPRGVVLSASYEARRSGIRSGMPTSRARLLCPRITVVPPDHQRYQE